MYKLFNIAPTVYVEPHKAFVYFYFIEKAVNKAIIQHERIKHDKLSVSNYDPSSELFKRNMTQLFADVHYYFVCWSEVYKLHRKLAGVQYLFSLPKKHLKIMKTHNEVRNDLEHIDEEMKKGTSELGTLSNGTFSFNKKPINIGDNDLLSLKEIYVNLLEIAKDNHPENTHDFELNLVISRARHEIKSASIS